MLSALAQDWFPGLGELFGFSGRDYRARRRKQRDANTVRVTNHFRSHAQMLSNAGKRKRLKRLLVFVGPIPSHPLQAVQVCVRLHLFNRCPVHHWLPCSFHAATRKQNTAQSVPQAKSFWGSCNPWRPDSSRRTKTSTMLQEPLRQAACRQVVPF